MPEIKYLEVVQMANGELICFGKTVGWVKDLGKYLHNKNEIIRHFKCDECGFKTVWTLDSAIEMGLPICPDGHDIKEED